MENEAKRFDPSERNFNFEFRSWATALSKFETLFLPLNSLEIQAFDLNFCFRCANFGYFATLNMTKIQAFELEFNFLLRKIPTP